MIRLAVSVEGQTEEEFVKRVLACHLGQRGVEPTPILIGSGRGGAGGGDVSVQRLSSDMAKLYWNFDFVTSLVDFYGFPGRGSLSVDELEKRLLQEIEARVPSNFDARKVMPYVQRHEFEGLLFSDVGAFGRLPGVSDEALSRLRSIRNAFATPEEINSDPDTAPSKRIVNALSAYRKLLHGPVIAEAIGLAGMRAECPRFDGWISRLERLSD